MSVIVLQKIEEYMLRPIRPAKSKKNLKIDEYQAKLHKYDQEQQHILMVKSITIPILQPLPENVERQHSSSSKKHLLNHSGYSRCSRQKRHQSACKKNQGFRIKKNFKTHEFMKGFGDIDQGDYFKKILSAGEKQKIISDIIAVLKKTGILNESKEQMFEIRVENLSKMIDYLISLNQKNFQHKSQENQPSDQNFFISQLDELMKSQSMKNLRIHLNCPQECQLKIEQKIQRDRKIQQERRKKSAILDDLQKKLNQKLGKMLDLQQKITHLKSVLQKYQSKAFNMDHYLNKQNQVYIKQLCKEYSKLICDINSTSVIIQAWESKNTANNSAFQDIQDKVRAQLEVIKQRLVDGKSIQNQATFVKNFLIRVMQDLKIKYGLLQKMLDKKTSWITELIKKIKKLLQLGSFRHEYVQNLVNQFTFTFLQAEDKLKMLMKNLQKQNKAADYVGMVQQVYTFVQSMNQNYLLTAAFN